MPSNINLFRKYNNNSIFIETGSCNGEGIRNALFAGYKDIYSIELADKYYQYCKSYFRYTDNVYLFLGDSVKRLPSILNNIHSSATFWLDAHYSGGDTGFTGVLNPLMQELEIIKEHSVKTHTIIIDDIREWRRDFPAIGFGEEDIRNKILEINPDYMFNYEDGYIENDILVATPKGKKPINIVIFSKDRAMQLDLLIRSFNMLVKNSDLFTLNVLYTSSTPQFQRGYDRLIAKRYSNVVFWRESSFKDDLLKLVDPDKEHAVFFVDDIVFKNPFNFYDKQMDVFNWDESIVCRSLRLHKNLSYCYPLQKPIKPPFFFENNVFNWRGEQGDYGYPMSLDGHIFRSKDILPLLVSFNYSNPNTLEGELAGHKEVAPKMICYDRSVLLSNPLNKVQTVNNNVCGTVTASFLNERFLDGLIIEIDNFVGLENSSCHQEVEVKFIQG